MRVLFDDVGRYIEIDGVDYHCKGAWFMNYVNEILTPIQLDKYSGCDTARLFTVSKKRVDNFIAYYNANKQK